MTGKRPKPRPPGKTSRKPPCHEQKHEATIDEFEQEGMGVASKE